MNGEAGKHRKSGLRDGAWALSSSLNPILSDRRTRAFSNLFRAYGKRMGAHGCHRPLRAECAWRAHVSQEGRYNCTPVGRIAVCKGLAVPGVSTQSPREHHGHLVVHEKPGRAPKDALGYQATGPGDQRTRAGPARPLEPFAQVRRRRDASERVGIHGSARYGISRHL